MRYDPIPLCGEWTIALENGLRGVARLPGTLDTNGIGEPDAPEIATRLTRLHTYTGMARFEREATLPRVEGGRLFLYAERSRRLSLSVDGWQVMKRGGTLSTPYCFELTPWADGETHRLALTVDNALRGLPAKEILYSSAATDETQTNWNGVLGRLELQRRDAVFVEQARLLLGGSQDAAVVTVDASQPWEGEVALLCGALQGELSARVAVNAGRTDVRIPVEIRPDAARWDELDGRLHALTVTLNGEEAFHTRVGIRSFGANAEGRLTLNGRAFFLRGEANCCVFPEEGHPPMTAERWREVLQVYASYGVNCMRFHSHCPPEAAFTAADELGMLMQPELSHWDPSRAFSTRESRRYYREELLEILRAYGHHPSFVMLTLGNELWTDEAGRAEMRRLLADARTEDDTRLYAWGSNAFYGSLLPDESNGFYTSASCGEKMLRATSAGMVGHLNEAPPDTLHTYDAAMDDVRRRFAAPVFGFEVGQYEVLPDFDEIDEFRGVTRAVNYDIVRRRVERMGALPQWKAWVEATGELSLLGYREEVEAVLRTGRMSGLSLLGLQDFPGQGTALVGMLNSHLRPKPYDFAKPERFAAFFRPVLPLAMLPARCFRAGETLTLQAAVANHGREALHGAPRWTLCGGGASVEGEWEALTCPTGTVTRLDAVEIPLTAWSSPTALTLALRMGDEVNEYSLWVYPDEPIDAGDTLVTQSPREAVDALRQGRRVLLSPEATSAAMPRGIRSQFSTDFWSVGTFPQQEGAMGLFIEKEHPIFERFPTRQHADWQWWRMAGGRAFPLPQGVEPIVRVLDSYQYLRNLGLLMECRVGDGRLMLSGMGLMEHRESVEARALMGAILRYMGSGAFEPRAELNERDVLEIFEAENKDE